MSFEGPFQLKPFYDSMSVKKDPEHNSHKGADNRTFPKTGTTDVFGVGWTGFWYWMDRFLVRPHSTFSSSSWHGQGLSVLCKKGKPRGPTQTSQILEKGEPRGSATVDSMSCLMLKLFQALEDP